MRSLYCRRGLVALLGTVAVIAAEGCAGQIRPAHPVNPTAARPPVTFTATAYCTGQKTASGAAVKSGMVAADPRLLPLGSIIAVSGLHDRHDGVYTVTDTGSKVRGHRLDIYMHDCHEAVRFGRRRVQVSLYTKG